MALTIQGDRETEIDELSEINVTPFIDVMLVLLIIFMVAAPLSTVDISVDLPVSNAVQQPRPDKPVFLTVKGDMTLAIGDDPLARETLAQTLDAQTGGDHDGRVTASHEHRGHAPLQPGSHACVHHGRTGPPAFVSSSPTSAIRR